MKERKQAIQAAYAKAPRHIKIAISRFYRFDDNPDAKQRESRVRRAEALLGIRDWNRMEVYYP